MYVGERERDTRTHTHTERKKEREREREAEALYICTRSNGTDKIAIRVAMATI